MIVLTIVDEHHEDAHEILLPDGVVPMGWYPTSAIDGHFHGVVLEEDLEPGESVDLVTDLSMGEVVAGRHAHEVRVTAREVEHDEETPSEVTEDAPEEPEEVVELRSKSPIAETKRSPVRIAEVKQSSRNGVPVGVVAGYLSTWEPDTGGKFGVPDKFRRGAWLDSLAEHRARGMRQIRLKDMHGRTIGGFPIDTVREDDVGLWGVGEINLETQQGREAYALARQGVLVDFSVGYVALDDKLMTGLREIYRAALLEASIVDEPANQGARILEIKRAVPFQDLPLASREREWDSDAAISRVRRATGSEESPSEEYRRAFLWFDADDAENFGAYKLPIADAIDGELRAVPRAVFAAAAALRGARGGVDIPETERSAVVSHVERYYAKMDEESPFEGDSRSSTIDVETARAMTPRELERKLRATGEFTVKAARVIASRVKDAPATSSEPTDDDVRYDESEVDAILENLRGARKVLAGR